jgi:hypothetical protein
MEQVSTHFKFYITFAHHAVEAHLTMFPTRLPIVTSLKRNYTSVNSTDGSTVQSDRKVTQPILKYLLMVAIEFNLIGLINTQYRRDYTRAHTGDVML